ncbi:MAG TPA: TetR/AcrR family transcriptional regulator, partial [Paraburkholderia sp.]|nr:TetR/AcrR family transcriptional regulator [Paraburkholderia sp.]
MDATPDTPQRLTDRKRAAVIAAATEEFLAA